MVNQEWKYHIRAEKLPVFLCLIMFGIFGWVTLWLYSADNGAFLFTGLLSFILLALVIATLNRLLFYRVSIGSAGFYFQTNPFNGRYVSYSRVEKAWTNKGTAQNGTEQEFCNIEVSGTQVIRFQYFEKDRSAVKYLIRLVAANNNNRADYGASTEKEYVIDGKVFGKTRIVIAVITTIFLSILDVAILKATHNFLLGLPGILMIGYLLYTIVINYLFFTIRIKENGFYFRTNPFNGEEYLYTDISSCQMIKRVVRIRRAREASAPKYYFFFKFTDKLGNTRQFQYEKPIHGHEVQILKVRIEQAKEQSFGDEIVIR